MRSHFFTREGAKRDSKAGLEGNENFVIFRTLENDFMNLWMLETLVMLLGVF